MTSAQSSQARQLYRYFENVMIYPVKSRLWSLSIYSLKLQYCGTFLFCDDMRRCWQLPAAFLPLLRHRDLLLRSGTIVKMPSPSDRWWTEKQRGKQDGESAHFLWYPSCRDMQFWGRGACNPYFITVSNWLAFFVNYWYCCMFLGYSLIDVILYFNKTIATKLFYFCPFLQFPIYSTEAISNFSYLRFYSKQELPKSPWRQHLPLYHLRAHWDSAC